MTNLILLRHGESILNKEDILSGLIDCVLTKNGMAQAIRTGEKIKHIKIDMIHTSQLERAKKTALLIADQFPNRYALLKNLNFYSYLNERSWGIYENVKTEKLLKYHSREELFSNIHFKPKNGESIVEHFKKVNYYYNNILKPLLSNNVNVMVVSHYYTMLGLIMLIENLNFDIYKKSLKNCETIHYYI